MKKNFKKTEPRTEHLRQISKKITSRGQIFQNKIVNDVELVLVISDPGALAERGGQEYDRRQRFPVSSVSVDSLLAFLQYF